MRIKIIKEDGTVSYEEIADEKQVKRTLTLEEEKAEKTREINSYDTSNDVNGFYIKTNGVTVNYWMNAQTRNQLRSSVTIWKAAHDKYTLDLREYNMSVEINCETFLTMLSTLEDYAIACYNQTSVHLSAVAALKTVTDVEAYNYKTGYPDKLTFEL